jgi:hypothetical protein
LRLFSADALAINTIQKLERDATAKLIVLLTLRAMSHVALFTFLGYPPAGNGSRAGERAPQGWGDLDMTDDNTPSRRLPSP